MAPLRARVVAAPLPPARARIEVPMRATTVRGEGRAQEPANPAILRDSDCGTAFLYLARVDGESARAVFGFQHLAHRAVAYNAHATFVNEDMGFTVADHAKGAMFFRTHYQREVTKHTGTGRVTVYAHIQIWHDHGSTCHSDPGLFQRIYVY